MLKFISRFFYKYRFIISEIFHKKIIPLSCEFVRPDQIELAPKVYVGHHSTFCCHRNKISIGKNSKIYPFVLIEAINEGVIIGENSTVNQFSIIRAYGKVDIGKGVRIGPSVQILALNHVFSDPKLWIYEQGITGTGISIQDNVWIGGNAIILDGVNIGKNCIIGAGSVVTKNIPSNSLAVGNPCKVIKKIVSKI